MMMFQSEGSGDQQGRQRFTLEVHRDLSLVLYRDFTVGVPMTLSDRLKKSVVFRRCDGPIIVYRHE